MTDIINGAFMEDLSELLNSATGGQRRRKTFYEIDTEFEKMTASLLKNFNSMASLMPFLRASLRQTMIRKLASVGKNKDGWKKADEHLTTLIGLRSLVFHGNVGIRKALRCCPPDARRPSRRSSWIKST